MKVEGATELEGEVGSEHWQGSTFCVHLVYGGVESFRALCPLGNEIGKTALSPRPRVSRHPSFSCRLVNV